MPIKTNLLIVGAGPFGLSLSAYCNHQNIENILVGKNMDFWKSNMPNGMYLRSSFDWHLDPFDKYTFEKFMKDNDLDLMENYPVSRDLYLKYTDWFVRKLNIVPKELMIEKIDYSSEKNEFTSYLDNSDQIISKNVVIAVGFKYFKHIPSELLEIIPENKYTHTCDIPDFNQFAGKRCLIIGGRMSAFESAVLLNESDAKEIFVSYRHDTPDFTESDWSWVNDYLDRFITEPEWYKNLSDQGKAKLNQDFYKEGRLKMEPWLTPKLDKDNINLLPNTQIKSSRLLTDNKIELVFIDNKKIAVDHVIFATGYEVDINKIPFISSGNILNQLDLDNGFPKLDINLQTNIPGLYMTSISATQDFGSFFGFTVSCNTSSKIIGRALN